MNKIIIKSKNLIYNIGYIKTLLKKETKICFMVKANAYGHGIKNIVTIAKEHVDYFGVSCLKEANIVKKYTNKKIIIFGVCDNLVSAITNEFEISINSITQYNEIERICELLQLPANIHIALNTGMNRYGIKSKSEFDDIFTKATDNKFINIKGIYTHFCTITSNKEILEKQYIKFKKFLKDKDLSNIIIHTGGSEICFKSEKFIFDMVRIGISAYGYSEFCTKLLPVMSVKSEVINIIKCYKNEIVGYDGIYKTDKIGYIATIPIGYADGVNRLLANKYMVKIKNKYYPIVGKICMDCFMVLVDETVEVGDEVVFFDSCKQIAAICNTIPYEIATNIKHDRYKVCVLN